MSETENKRYTDICEEARKRFAHIVDVDKDNRDNQKSDTKFVYTPGEQWPADVRNQRTQWKEVCLEFNQLKQFVSQVINDMRQNQAGIRVHAASGDASQEVATIEQGMIRAIEYESKASTVYDNAAQGSVVGGRGWHRVVSEYTNADPNDRFQQKLMIKPIADPLTVYASLDYQEPDASDRMYLFVVESVPKDEFALRYPDAEPMDWDNLDKQWMYEGKNVFVADYYRRVCKTRTMVRMSDGSEGWKDEMPTPPEGITVKRERECETYTVEWFKLAGGAQVLDEYEWPGTIIPVIQTVGEDIMLDGKRVYQGLTRHARDAQTMLNFGMTQQAIHLSLTPRAPWVAAAKAIAGYENIYRDANAKNYSVLPYNDWDSENNRPIQAPSRQLPSMPDQGWIQWCQNQLAMIRSTIGMYENSLGQKGQETSGVAIRQREHQGDNATFNYADNRARAIALTGRILVEVIPHYYDSARIVHTIGIDDTRKQVGINQPGVEQDPETGALNAIKHNDVTVGTFAVTVESGPSYSTKRQESSEKLLGFVKAFPPAAAVAGDIIAKSLDVADGDQLADRMKLMLPPQIQKAEAAKAQGGKPPDPQTQAQLQQLNQQLELAKTTMDKMHAENQDLKSGAAAKQQAAQLEAQAKKEAAAQETEVTIAKAQASSNADWHIAQERARVDIEKAELEARVQIRKAMIARATQLEIQEMKNDTSLSIADADREAAADLATQPEQTTEQQP